MLFEASNIGLLADIIPRISCGFRTKYRVIRCRRIKIFEKQTNKNQRIYRNIPLKLPQQAKSFCQAMSYFIF